MSDEEQQYNKGDRESEEPAERLFATRILEGIPAEVITDQDVLAPLSFFGEIVLDGEQQEGGNFVPLKLVRLALIGEPLAGADNNIADLQTIDLAGPLQETPIMPASEKEPGYWVVEPVPMRLYYSKLGHLATLTEEEPEFPPHPEAELALCNFTLHQTPTKAGEGVPLTLADLSIKIVEESILEGGGVVQSVFFAPVDLTFQELKPRGPADYKSGAQPLKM